MASLQTPLTFNEHSVLLKDIDRSRIDNCVLTTLILLTPKDPVTGTTDLMFLARTWGLTDRKELLAVLESGGRPFTVSHIMQFCECTNITSVQFFIKLEQVKRGSVT